MTDILATPSRRTRARVAAAAAAAQSQSQSQSQSSSQSAAAATTAAGDNSTSPFSTPHTTPGTSSRFMATRTRARGAIDMSIGAGTTQGSQQGTSSSLLSSVSASTRKRGAKKQISSSSQTTTTTDDTTGHSQAQTHAPTQKRLEHRPVFRFDAPTISVNSVRGYQQRVYNGLVRRFLRSRQRQQQHHHQQQLQQSTPPPFSPSFVDQLGSDLADIVASPLMGSDAWAVLMEMVDNQQQQAQSLQHQQQHQQQQQQDPNVVIAFDNAFSLKISRP